MSFLTLTPSYILDQYEILRKEAIEACEVRAAGHGLALLLQRGMTAWISALSALEPRPRSVPLQDIFSHSQVELTPAVRCDLTALMAEMVLTCLGGTHR